jgi:hypothetical protein
LFSGAIGSANLPAFHHKPMFISVNKLVFFKEQVVGSSFFNAVFQMVPVDEGVE